LGLKGRNSRKERIVLFTTVHGVQIKDDMGGRCDAHGQVRNTNILVRRSSREKKPSQRWNDDKWILKEQGVDWIELVL
jgi:hypothetical protein